VSILKRLKSETAPAHERIEQAFDLKVRTGCVTAYRELLARFYGFHIVWEPCIEAALGHPAFCRKRRKTRLLVDDLRALGVSEREIGQLPFCDRLMPMHSPAEALGSMYVVEGSTLGGTIIARQIGHRLGLGAGNGCSYFRCYGDQVGPMWKAFRAELLTQTRSHDEDVVIASANRTFDILHAWLFPS
jgi:heme oxygenase (biliverdin-IX-beta and delta-forming)